MAFEIEYADAPLGHKIHGVDLANLSEQEFRQVEDTWNQYGVVIVTGQKLTADQLLDYSRRYGPLEKFVIDAYNLPSNPEIFVVSNVIENGKPIGMADAGRMWHSDMCFTPEPSRGSALYALEVPKADDGTPLGDTCFASTAAAFDALPSDLRERISGLRAVNSFSARNAAAAERGAKDPTVDAVALEHLKAQRDKSSVPDVDHPLVRTHPVTGRKCLYVSELITSEIIGLPREEGGALLKQLLEHITSAPFVYRHSWSVGDVVMWDNCSSMHYAIGDYQLPQRRLMYRSTIRGGRPV